ncbi:CLASP N terminal domain containing protein [Elaphomyces granulatus]
MESRAAELLAILKNPNTSVEAKVAHLTGTKSDIKQRNVPEAAIAPIFEALRLAVASQHSSLSTAGFSALGHLLKRLYIQEHHHAVVTQARHLYPLLLERLGDHRERIRAHAAQAFTDLWLATQTEVEHHVLEVALVGKNPRAKEMSMFWLSNMTKEHGLLFRTYVPSLVACLEDADSGVRETAKQTVIELFQNAPSRANSDLKKQLVVHNVRKSIATAILASLGLATVDQDLSSSHSRSEIRRPGSSLSTHRARDDPPRPNSVLSARSQGNGEATKDELDVPRPRVLVSKSESSRPPILSHSVSIESLAASAAEVVEGERIEPLDVNSNREVDEIVRGLLPHFEGRETEQNWMPREKAILTLRRLTRGNAPHLYTQHYMAAIKSLLDGILKVVNSLRTTLSTCGCLLIQDMAKICGSGIDHLLDILMQNLIKLCAGMKKISAQNGNTTVDILIGSISYNPRILQHLWLACQDKNVQPRLYTTGWLKTLINKYARHRSSIEHSGGLELIEKCIKKGLADPNPGVRESMRGTFWTFFGLWPDRATEILSTLDNKSKTLLEKDPANPNPNSLSTGVIEQPRSTFSSSTSAASGRQALKETIAAQKKRLAAENKAPPRPESAQSSFPEAETKPSRLPAHRAPAAKSATVRTVPTGAHLSTLSSAPMRPAIKPRRPELARPATADPYSDRRPPSAASHRKASSPDDSPPKPKARLLATPGPKSTGAPRPKSTTIDAAPVSTAKIRARRLDISTLKGGDDRSLANRLRSNSNDLPRSALGVEESVSRVMPRVRALEDPEHVFEDPKLVREAIPVSYQDAVAVAETSSESQLPEKPTTPVPHSQISDDGTVPRPPISAQRHSRTTSEESKAASPVPLSPNGPHSISGSGNHASEVPTPTMQCSVSRPEEILYPENPKVYEDPEPPASPQAVGSPSRSPNIPFSSVKPSVLEELPVNEPTILSQRDNKQSPMPERISRLSQVLSPDAENTHRRWGKIESAEKWRSISPRSKDPIKAREMIDKGINRIRAKALDVHGYRKLQGLLKYHETIFADEAKYDEMLMALIEALEAPGDDKRSTLGRPLDLKTQILVTIRLMLALNKTYFSTYYPRVMTALLNTRKHYELTNHIVSGLEKTSEDIVATCDPPDVIDAVLDLIETEGKDEEGYRSITMGIYVLKGLLRRLNKNRVYLHHPEVERLGKLANKNLAEPQPDIRRAITDFCVELHEMVNDEELFWRMIGSPTGDLRNLLTYYIVKQSSQVAQA